MRIRKTQHVARDLLDEIGIRQIWTKKRDVPRKLGTYGLEALDLELERALTLEQPISRLEAVTAFECMEGEVGC